MGGDTNSPANLVKRTSSLTLNSPHPLLVRIIRPVATNKLIS